MSGRVIVVGSVNIDEVVTVTRLPAAGETVIGGRYERHHGGKGANQAVAAARLGARVAFIGAVGADAFGAEARAALEAEGIDLSGLIELPGDPTGVALILVDRAGENAIAVASGANAAMSSVAVRAALKRLVPTAGDVILVGHEIRTGAAHEALRLGRIAGATTILNPAPAGGLARPTLDLADILTPNAGELDALAGPGKPAAQAKRLLGVRREAVGPRQPRRRWRDARRRPPVDRDPRPARRGRRHGRCRGHAQRRAGRRPGGRPRAGGCRASSGRRGQPGGHAGRCP